MRILALALFMAAGAARADAEAWKGFYGGLGFGAGRAHSTWTTDATLGTLDEPVDHKANGALLGAQYGYRAPVGDHLLLGLEAAWYGGRMEERAPANLPGIPSRERVTKVMNPFSAVVQLGFATARSLTYVRGGFAYAMLELQAINHQVGNVATWESHATGWTAGAGFEYNVHRRWSLGLEYDYAKLRAVDLSTVNSGGVIVQAADFQATVKLLLLRLNYRY